MHHTRRRFLGLTLGSLALPILAACGSPPVPTAAPPTAAPPTAAARIDPTAAPTIRSEPPTPVPPTATPKPRTGEMTSPDYSVQVFLWGGFNTTQRDLGLVREMGFGWVKQMFEWRYIEPHIKGKFDWGEPDRIVDAIDRAGLKVIARIDNQPKWTRADASWPTPGPPDKLSDFGDFISAMAERYKGRIQAYQIWNEPNLAREWGNQPPNPRQYVEMLKIAHTAVKRADPAAQIITAGLSPTTATGAIAMPDVDYAKAMYGAGAKEYFDTFGVHAAGFKAPPELSPDEIARDTTYNHGEAAKGRVYGFRHAEDLRAIMVANGDAAKRVAILEFGWTSDPRPSSPYNWHAVTEEQKADYLLRAFDFARKNWQPWIGAMNVIYVADPNWTRDHEQYYWSLTNPDGTQRPAYRALQNMTKDPVPSTAAGGAPGVSSGAAVATRPTAPANAASPATPASNPTRPVATP